MEVSGTSQTTGQNAEATSRATRSAQTLAGDFDQFLTLLTTQLQYQDPTNPVDSKEFTQQLVQFTQAEQMVNTNSNLEKLIDLQTSSQVADGANYIGKIVDAEGNTAPLKDGRAEFHYSLGATAEDVKIAVIDANGDIVYSQSGETGAGQHDFVWNGVSKDGETMPEGAYRISIVATDEAGESIDVSTTVSGLVDGIQIVDGEMTLSVGGLGLSMDQVIGVRAADQAPGGDGDGGDGTGDETA